MSEELPAQVRTWLDQPTLSQLWDRVHHRLERNGRVPAGRINLPYASDDERDALSLLTGRTVRRRTQGDVTVDLADVDTALRQSAAGCGLLDVVTALRGPVADRRGARQQQLAAWEATWSAADQAIATGKLAGTAWARAWLEEVRAGGSLARLGPERATELLRQASAVLATLLPSDPGAGYLSPTGSQNLGELAVRHTGTAHGLDDGTVLARLVLRGLTHAFALPFPTDPRARRELWEAAGVLPDTIATTVLTYALDAGEVGWSAALLRQREAHHAETHLTVRDVRRTQWRLPRGTTVFVCENPRVIEAAADGRCSRPMVCTSGNPTHTVLALLDALTTAGAVLAYHGDFDWPGIAIANRIITRYQARSWQMSAADYERHVALLRSRGTPPLRLVNAPVEAVWDTELTATMDTVGVAVHEESTIESLLADLTA